MTAREEEPAKMTADSEFQALREEVFRRVGRNLLNYQRLEYMLKFLVAAGVSGPAAELASLAEAHRSKTPKKTLGPIGEDFKKLLVDAGEVDEPEPSLHSSHASISIRLETGPRENAALRDGLSAVIEERNQLAHGIYDRWDGRSVESTRALLDHLDAQRERLIPVFTRVQEMTLAVQEHISYLDSPEGKHWIDVGYLRGSRLVAALQICASEMARPDGWLALGTAAQAIKAELPGELDKLKERFGYATLKSLVLGTQMFDVKDEPTMRGFRTVYRLKPDHSSG